MSPKGEIYFDLKFLLWWTSEYLFMLNTGVKYEQLLHSAKCCDCGVLRDHLTTGTKIFQSSEIEWCYLLIKIRLQPRRLNKFTEIFIYLLQVLFEIPSSRSFCQKSLRQVTNGRSMWNVTCPGICLRMEPYILPPAIYFAAWLGRAERSGGGSGWWWEDMMILALPDYVWSLYRHSWL